jgi:hypothetical protein
MWRVRFNDGYNREVTRECSTEEEAFTAACSLRRRYLDLSVEAPDGQIYDEVAIVDWCQKHEM